MRQSTARRLNIQWVVLLFSSISVLAQNQSKTFKESFKVNSDVVVDINTSHADVAFETWNKDEIEVEAIIELEGATPEQAEKYFSKNPVTIMGNSQLINVRTKAENLWSFRGHLDNVNLEDIIVEIPEIPSLEPLFLDLEIPELPEFEELAEMPEIPEIEFDYDAFTNDYEAYMKKWQSSLKDKFGKEYQDKMKAWAERMQQRSEAWEARMEERKEERQQRMEELQERMEARQKEHEIRLQEREARREEAEQVRKQAMEERKEAMEAVQKEREKVQKLRREMVISAEDGDAPSIFYLDVDGVKRNYKIKKRIRIKMPKNTRLKMNVRHGEVKLAENVRNIQASLTYGRLLATNIDGNQSIINARYTPVIVKSWNDGKLKADFSDEVSLFEVRNLDLSANSSDVTIDRLLSQAYINNSLGALRINSIDGNFKFMNVSVKNGELTCDLPASDFEIAVIARNSELAYPEHLVLKSDKENGFTRYTGYQRKKDAGKSIVINASYSQVVLEK